MRVSNFHFEVSRHYRNYAEWKTVLEIEIIKTQEIFRQFQDKRTGEPAKKRFSSQSENAARGKSNFPEMAKCHLSTKPFFVRGKTPFVRPAHFLSVAKRHSPASSFSVRGKMPRVAQLIFCQWRNIFRCRIFVSALQILNSILPEKCRK